VLLGQRRNSDPPLAEAEQDHRECEEQRRSGDLAKRIFTAQRWEHVSNHAERREHLSAVENRVEDAGQRAAGD
jgi:hypothetical protein